MIGRVGKSAVGAVTLLLLLIGCCCIPPNALAFSTITPTTTGAVLKRTLTEQPHGSIIRSPSSLLLQGSLLGMEEASSQLLLTQLATSSSSSPPLPQLEPLPQSPLDALGIDPGQALFYSTLVHWGLWAKTPTYVALTFDAICIAITLWDGTVRAQLGTAAIQL